MVVNLSLLVYDKDKEKERSYEVMDDQEKVRKAKNEYLRKWRKENKEKVKEHQDRYFLKKFEQSVEEERERRK